MSEISKVIRTKLLPWAQQETTDRFIVARSKMHASQLPPGMKLTPRKITGKRVVVKNERNYSNARNIVAQWPDDGLHEVNKYALVCVLNGYIDYPLGNYRLQCGPGYFIFIPPGLPFPQGRQTYVDLQRSTSCDIITFLLHRDALECWRSHGHPQGRDIKDYSLIIDRRVVSLLEMLVQEAVSNEESTPQINRVLLSAFLVMLKREIDAGRFQHVPINISEITKTPESDFIARLEHYTKSNLHHKLTLDVIAREMYLSQTQFKRVIRRETGKSFNEFLTFFRMEEAKRMLIESPWTAAMIGKAVGFKSPSYFRTSFKRYTGQTPMDFRNNARLPTNKNGRISNAVDG